MKFFLWVSNALLLFLKSRISRDGKKNKSLNFLSQAKGNGLKSDVSTEKNTRVTARAVELLKKRNDIKNICRDLNNRFGKFRQPPQTVGLFPV